MKYVKKQSGFAWAAIISVFFIVIGFFCQYNGIKWENGRFGKAVYCE